MRRHLRAVIPVLIGAATAWVAVLAQLGPSPTTQTPVERDIERTFEVASVRVRVERSEVSYVRLQPGGRLMAVDVPLRLLLRFAYGMRDERIRGGPSWMNTERFDLEATAGRDVPPDEIRILTQNLLRQRFALVARREFVTVPVFALRALQGRGILGPRARPSAIDCDEVLRTVRQQSGPPPPPGESPACGMGGMPGRLRGVAVTLSQLAASLESPAGRPVIDATDILGRFDVELRWTPFQPGAEPASPVGGVPNDLDTPALETALREQLGLRLEPTNAPIEMLVVQSASMPTPN
jgi:uncharacterized protein (TIGR03435 family)